MYNKNAVKLFSHHTLQQRTKPSTRCTKYGSGRAIQSHHQVLHYTTATPVEARCTQQPSLLTADSCLPLLKRLALKRQFHYLPFALKDTVGKI